MDWEIGVKVQLGKVAASEMLWLLHRSQALCERACTEVGITSASFDDSDELI